MVAQGYEPCDWKNKRLQDYNGQRKRSIQIISSKFDTKDPSVNENFIQQQRITFN